MLEMNSKEKTLVRVVETGLKEENLLERYDLQECIVNSWENFTEEIGLPNIYYAGKEISPHESNQDRIDVLGFDPNDSSFVIIELKRDKQKNQLIQAISYAGMVNTWTSTNVIKILQNQKNPEADSDLLDMFQQGEIDFSIKIVVVAESFDPEVILAADWLKSEYGINIAAFSMQLHKIDTKLLLDIDQRYPLKELSDAYEARKRRQIQQNSGDVSASWDDIASKLSYEYGKDAINKLLKINSGDIKRHRFVTTITKDDIRNMIFGFRRKYINIYAWTQDKINATTRVQQIFGQSIKVSEWAQGISFNIETQEEYKKMIKWLEI
jgi:hypothetical protein